jgi:exodeoxyribonuclease VII large subunit
VARALAACPVPTISAVGHETDITICDLVADARAATPSAAAELAVPSRRETSARVAALGHRLHAAWRRHRERAAEAVEGRGHGFARAAQATVERRRARLALLAGQLNALSPLAVLARGYAVARGLDGASLSRTEQFADGMPFQLRLEDGVVDATVRASRRSPVVSDSPAGERE